jgi:hypothetical protein
MSTPMKKRPIGSIFVEKGFVTQDQLDEALREQQQSGQRLGEILVERGHISRIDLASVIGNQLEGLRLLQGGLATNAAPAVSAAAVAPVAPPAPDRSGEIAELERRLANQAETIDHLLDQVNELQAAVAAAEARAREPEAPTDAEPPRPAGLVVVDP